MNLSPAERKLVRLPRAQLHPDPNQPRKEFDQTKLLELAANLRAVKQQNPLIVWACDQLPENHYLIGDGERRWRAAPFVPVDELDCIVLAAPADPLAMLTIQLSLGATNEKLNPFELAEGAATVMRARNLNQDDMAETLGISSSKLSKAMGIKGHLAHELRPDVESGCIPWTIAAQLARLRDNIPLQLELAAKIKEGILKRESIEKAVAAALGKSKGKSKAKPLRIKSGGGLLVFTEPSPERLQAFLESVAGALKRVVKESLPLDVIQALLKQG